MLRRIGSPMQVACGSGVVGKEVKTCRVSRAASRLARPGRSVLLVQHDRQAEPPGGQVGRGGHVATETEHRLGLDPAEHARRSAAPPAPAGARPGPGPHRAAGASAPAGSAPAVRPAAGITVVSRPRAVPTAVSRRSGRWSTQLVRGGDQGRGVPGGPAAGQHHRAGPGSSAGSGGPAVARPGHRGHPRHRPLGRRASIARASGSRRAQPSSTPTASRLAISAEPP